VANIRANRLLSYLIRKNQNLKDKNNATPHILILSLGRGGGCSQYTFEILKHFSLPYTLYQTTYTIEDAKPEAKPIRTYKKNKLSFALNTAFRLPFILFKIFLESRQYSALFCPYFHFWNLGFIMIFKLLRKPIIVIEHDGIIHSGDELPFQQFLINQCIKHATSLIFLTHFVKHRIPKHLLSNKHISIIPHGVFDFKGLDTSEKIFSPKPILLFFGRVNKYKGIELLLDALFTIPPESFDRLIIAGKSSYRYDLSAYSRDFLAKLEIYDEFLSQEKIAKIFNRAHILIMPYLEASQSGVASIAIANAIPTVCSDVGGLKEQFILANAHTCIENPSENSRDDDKNPAIAHANSSICDEFLRFCERANEAYIDIRPSVASEAILKKSRKDEFANGQDENIDRICAIIVPPTREDICRAIKKLIHDKILYQRLSHNLTLRSGELKWQNIATSIQSHMIKTIGNQRTKSPKIRHL